MNFQEEHSKHLNTYAYTLVELVEESENEPTLNVNFKGSLVNRKVLDISDKIIDEPVLEQEFHGENIVSIKKCHNGRCLGLNKENYEKYLKLVTDTYKEKSISNKVNKKFIEKHGIDWLFDCFKNMRSEVSYSQFILDRILSSIKKYDFHFAIPFLDIESTFKIGNVQFLFYSEIEIENMMNKFAEEHPEKESNPFEFLKKNSGEVYAMFSIEAEYDKGMEVALQECSLAVDILKICSNTVLIPELKLSFDIDSRIRFSPQSVILAFENSDNKKIPITSVIRTPTHHFLGEQDLNMMNERGLQEFSRFLSISKGEHSELEKLIVNAIRRFGNALSNHDIHQRITELFTILESLLLKDKNASILDSVCTYCSKLVSGNIDDRKLVIKNLKKMYEIRSDYIHHAKLSILKMEEVGMFQKIVLILLVNLIGKSNVVKEKRYLLGEIDEAILSAYSL